VRQNYAMLRDDDFLTPRWWLQPADSCMNCNCEIFNTTCPTSSPTASSTMLSSVSPTPSPTGSSSVSPTPSPTLSPTALPIKAPTAAPTATFLAPSVAEVILTFSGVAEEQFYSSGLDEVLIDLLAAKLGVDASNVAIVSVQIEGERRLGQQHQQFLSRSLKAAGDLIVTVEITAVVAASENAAWFTEVLDLLDNWDAIHVDMETFMQDNIPGASLNGLTAEVKESNTEQETQDDKKNSEETPFGFVAEVLWGGAAVGACLVFGVGLLVVKKQKSRKRSKSAFVMENPMPASHPELEHDVKHAWIA